MTHVTDKPLAIKGLVSYRYKGNYGSIMIGATDNDDALSEASRSLGQETASIDNLEIFKNGRYVKVQP